MYHSEVPLYGKLVKLVDDVNKDMVENHPEFKSEAGEFTESPPEMTDLAKHYHSVGRPSSSRTSWRYSTRQGFRTGHASTIVCSNEHVPRQLL